MTFGPKTPNEVLARELQSIAGLAGLTEVRLTLAEGEALEEAARRIRNLERVIE